MSSQYAPFVPSATRKSGTYFFATTARSALTWVIVSQNSSSTFPSTGRPPRSWAPGQLPAHHLGLGQGVPVHHSRRNGEAVKPFTLVGAPLRQRSAWRPGGCAPTTPHAGR